MAENSKHGPDHGLTRASFLKLIGGLMGGAALLAGGGVPAFAAPSMRTRPIPSSGEALPVIGLGTSRVFEIGGSKEERDSRREVLRLLLDGGGTVVDTSPMYGNAEEVVGGLLTDLGRRKETFIATKVWTEGGDEGVRQMESSMAKLHAPVIDLMQVHNLVDTDTHLKTLRRWKDEGRIRYIGITHWKTSMLDDLVDVVKREKLDFVQMAYSIAERDMDKRLLPLCAERGVATLINRPYDRGGVFKAVKGRPLPALAADIDCNSWGQFFLKFILSHPAVTCVIPGTGKPKHMRDNLGAGFGRLPDEKQRLEMLKTFQGG